MRGEGPLLLLFCLQFSPQHLADHGLGECRAEFDVTRDFVAYPPFFAESAYIFISVQLRSRNVERAVRAKRSLGRARCAAGEKQKGGILRTDACLDGLAGVVAQQIAQPLVSRLQRDPMAFFFSL